MQSVLLALRCGVCTVQTRRAVCPGLLSKSCIPTNPSEDLIVGSKVLGKSFVMCKPLFDKGVDGDNNNACEKKQKFASHF